MKRILCWLVVIMLICNVFLGVDLTAEAKTEWYTEGDFEYTVTNDGFAVLEKYLGNDTVVTIPDEFDGHIVYRIGNSAFNGCKMITHIDLPEKLIEIGNMAFRDCENLGAIEIPKSVTLMGESVFYDCINLQSIELPEGITEIRYGMFSYCTSLKNIVIPASVTYIGDSAFNRCDSLSNVYISDLKGWLELDMQGERRRCW